MSIARVPQVALTTITVGSAHACGLTTAGTAFCWGANDVGQLGIGTAERVDAGPVASTLVFSSISAGASHTCAVTAAGDIYCWGLNLDLALGNASTREECDGWPCSRAPIRVATTAKFDSVSAGYSHTCGLSRGLAFCWGRNDRLQLGRSSAGERCDGVPCSSIPMIVEGSSTFSSISAGGDHTCGVASGSAAGRVHCWGSNQFGQLARDSTARASAAPVVVAVAERLASVDAGGLHTCATSVTGRGFCWGRNAAGESGSSAPSYLTTPVPVIGNHRFAAISAGGTHSCGIATSRLVLCWGSNVDARLGVADDRTQERCARIPCSPAPLPSARSNLDQVVAGGTFSCGRSGLRTECWGTGTTSARTTASHTRREAARQTRSR